MSNAAEKVEPMQDIKERPILFSAPMVRAILEGRKTQTRRIVKPQPAGEWAAPGKTACPYGRPGERLWVRETWSRAKLYPASHELFYRADGECNGRQLSLSYIEREGRWRPSIHMPRWASRITLEITGVRVERLQEISEADAKAEGITVWEGDRLQRGDSAGRQDFAALWESINGSGSWDLNPWVWVIEFKKIELCAEAQARIAELDLQLAKAKEDLRHVEQCYLDAKNEIAQLRGDLYREIGSTSS